MQLSILLASALSATALAAPAYPDLNLGAASPDGIATVSEYFTMLALKVQQSRMMSEAPVCDLSKAVLPTGTNRPAFRPLLTSRVHVDTDRPQE